MAQAGDGTCWSTLLALLIQLLSLLTAALAFGSSVWAATIPTIGCSSTGYIFNTAYSGSPSGPPKPSGSRDTYWQVNASARDSVSPYTVNSSQWVDAYVVSQRAGWATSPFNNADWIAHNTDGSSPSTYQRYTYWYRYQFNLDPALDPSAFYMKLSFYADDSLGAVYVNGVAQSSSNIPDNIDANNYSPGYGATLVLDNSWKVGQNEILVRIADRGGWSGFLVQYDTQSSTICATRTTINVVSTGGTSTFGYTGTNGIASQSVSTVTPSTSASGPMQTLTAVNGTTTITQATTPPGYRLNAIACTGQDPGATLAYNTGASASAGVPARSVQFSYAGNGRALSCTFTNQAVGDGGAYWDGNGSANNNNNVAGGAGTWNASNANWTDANGAQNGAWAANGLAVFAGTGGAVNTTAQQTIGGLVFRGNGYSLSGSALTGGLATNTLTADAGVTALVGNPLAGGNAFQKTGAGTITLSGNSTYSGSTTVSAGTLALGVNNALPSAGAVTVTSGATLSLGGKSQSLSAGLAASGTLDLGTGGNITLGSNTTNSVAAITGSGTITVGSGATITLTVAIANSNVDIVLAGGTLNLGSFTHSLGTLKQTTASAISFTSSSSLTVASIGSTFTGTLTASGWTASSNHFYATAVNGSPARNTLGLATLNQIKLGTSGNSALTYWASGTSGELLASSGTYTYWDVTPGNGQIDGGPGNWDVAAINWANATGSANGTWAGGVNVATFGGSSGGTVTVSGTQSIGGLAFNTTGYALTGGTLNVAAATNTFSGTASIGSVITGGAGNALNVTGGTITLKGNNSFAGTTTVTSGTLAFNLGNFIESLYGLVVNNAAITFIGNASNAGQGYLFLGGAVSGAGSWTIDASAAPGTIGSNRLSFGAANTATGPITVQNYGSLWFETPGSSPGQVVNLNGVNTRLYVYGVSGGVIRVGTLTGTGAADFGDGTAGTSLTLSIGNDNGSGTFSGAIKNTGVTAGPVTLSLAKAGTGTQTLSGANTYKGTTTVSAGALVVNGSTSSSSAVSVSSGATLAGSGMVAGSVTVNGTLSPGATAAAGSVGTLNTGALTLVSGSTLAMDLAVSGTTGGVNDLVAVSGNLNLSGTLNINALSGFSTTGKYTLITYTGTRSGAFSATNLAAAGYLGIVEYDDAHGQVNLVSLPRVRITEVSNGGTGTFAFALSGLGSRNLSLSTASAGVGVTSATLSGSIAGAATVAQTSPANWPTTPSSVSCIDANGAGNGNITGNVGTLSANTVTLSSSAMRAGADITCTFTNTRNGISGVVFNDGGATSAGVNTGTPNDGIQNGTEAGLSGATVSLTNCAGTSYANTSTDGSGAYSLSIPTAQAGQTVCVAATAPTGYLATGANAAGTAVPSGTPTTVGGISFTYTRSSQQISFTAPANGALTLNFGQVPVSTLIPSSSKHAAAGASVVHGHRFTAGTGGSLQVSLGTATRTPTAPAWTEAVYLDPVCTNTVQTGATPLVSAITVMQGQLVCFEVQDFVPAVAANGTTNSVPVNAILSLTNAAPTLSASYSVTDTTTVLPAAVTLSKAVRNVTQGGGFTTTNQAKSGDTLEYQITYSNLSAQAVANLEVTDSMSQYATFVSANVSTTPASLTACFKNTPANALPAAGVACSTAQATGGTGSVSWKFTGSLNPGSSGTVLLRMTVN